MTGRKVITAKAENVDLPGTTDAEIDRELADLQRGQVEEDATSDVIEGKVTDKDGKTYDYVVLAGEKFRLREKVGAMAMFKWSAAADMDTDNPKALAAIYAMIKSVILKEDWYAFETHALDEDSDAEELLDVVTKGLEIIGGRPTKQS
jgi:hypothetical protein